MSIWSRGDNNVPPGSNRSRMLVKKIMKFLLLIRPMFFKRHFLQFFLLLLLFSVCWYNLYSFKVYPYSRLVVYSYTSITLTSIYLTETKNEKKKTIITFYLNFITKLNKLLYLTFNLTNYFSYSSIYLHHLSCRV